MEFVQLEAPIKTVSGQAKFAVQGLGLINALVDSHHIKAYLANQQLVPVLEPYWHLSVDPFLYYHQVKVEQPKMRVFTDFSYRKENTGRVTSTVRQIMDLDLLMPFKLYDIWKSTSDAQRPYQWYVHFRTKLSINSSVLYLLNTETNSYFYDSI